MVIIDDWGYGDVGYHDASMVTPELDSLARSGIVLEKFYSASTCTPSRAMLMTGRYNVRNGMQDSVLHSTESRGLPLDERLLPEKLRSVGYATAGVGKWHLGMSRRAYLPEQRGFDRWYGIYTGGGSHTGHFSVSQPFTSRGSAGSQTWQGFNLWEDSKPSQDNYGSSHSTHLYTRKAVEYVTDFNGPWFLYLAYQAVHDPMEVGDERYVRNTACANATSADISDRPTLCGMVAEVDDGIKTLRLAIDDDWASTLMLVLSDNGGVKAHGSSNFPLRGEKGTYYEGGVRVPALLAGGFVESALEASQATPFVFTDLVHLTDLHAALLDVAGYDIKAPLDGVSLWAQLFGEAPKRTELLLNINSDLFGGSGALIAGNFKLIVNPEPDEAAIYSKVRKALATYTKRLDVATFARVLEDVHDQVLGDRPTLALFDLDQNPQERDDASCAVPAQCRNLYYLEEYRSVRQDLETRFDEYKRQAAPSTFAWEDDGPLANPANFGGYWAPWRDGDDEPMAHYVGIEGLLPRNASSADEDHESAATRLQESLVTTVLQYSRASTFASFADDATSSTLPTQYNTALVAVISFCVGAFVSAKFVAIWRPSFAEPAWQPIP